jgi:hypothetical protein
MQCPRANARRRRDRIKMVMHLRMRFSRGKATIAPTRFAENELNELWDMRQCRQLPVMALGRHLRCVERCPLSGVQRTSRKVAVMSPNDPLRTSPPVARAIDFTL